MAECEEQLYRFIDILPGRRNLAYGCADFLEPDGAEEGGGGTNVRRTLAKDHRHVNCFLMAEFAFDQAGNIYIADSDDNRIRKVDASNIIST
jgi:hypothetical protein